MYEFFNDGVFVIMWNHCCINYTAFMKYIKRLKMHLIIFLRNNSQDMYRVYIETYLRSQLANLLHKASLETLN